MDHLPRIPSLPLHLLRMDRILDLSQILQIRLFPPQAEYHHELHFLLQILQLVIQDLIRLLDRSHRALC